MLNTYSDFIIYSTFVNSDFNRQWKTDMAYLSKYTSQNYWYDWFVYFACIAFVFYGSLFIATLSNKSFFLDNVWFIMFSLGICIRMPGLVQVYCFSLFLCVVESHMMMIYLKNVFLSLDEEGVSSFFYDERKKNRVI